MASIRTSTFTLRALLRNRPSSNPCTRCQHRFSSTSPVLSRLRPDLKSAMQNKDTTRLAVLRSILSAITNTSKTSTPINSDAALLAQLKRQIKSCEATRAEFEAAGRKDLADKEAAQIEVMKGYAGGVEVVSDEEIKTVVGEVMEKLKTEGKEAKMANVMFGVKEQFEGRTVDFSVVSKVVKEIVR